jgi:hypothetical protein
MQLTELKEPCLLDPQDAVHIPYRDLLALAGRQLNPASDPVTVYVPRIPIDAAEGEAMLRMTVTVSAGATDPATDPAMPSSPKAEARTYAGYTSEELSQQSTLLDL